MRDVAMVVALCCGLLTASPTLKNPAQAAKGATEQLSDQEVQAAIRCGRDPNCYDGIRLTSNFLGGATIRIEGPYGGSPRSLVKRRENTWSRRCPMSRRIFASPCWCSP